MTRPQIARDRLYKFLPRVVLQPLVLRYGLGVLAFALTVAVALGLRALSIRFDLSILAIGAMIVTAWYGGRGPGLMVVILFVLLTIVTSQQPVTTPRFIISQINVLILFSLLVLLVSAWKKSEGQLREQREWLRVTLSSIADAVITTDIDGQVRFMNPAAEAMTGWSMTQAANKPIGEVLQLSSEESLEVLNTPVSKLSGEGASGEMISGKTITSRNGTKRLINYTRAPIRDKAGKVSGAVLVFRDVTERINLEEQLRHAQKMEAIGRLAGGVAHDFNNLLTVIIGYGEMMMRSLKADESLRVFVKEILKAGERASSLTNQLLAFSRKQILQPRVLDLNETVADMEKMLCRLIGEDVELDTVLRPGIGCVLADPGQVEQIVMNLAVNARDAMPEGGKLTIETANVFLSEDYTREHLGVEPGPYVMLAISDSGCGMDKATQARIFEPFFTTKGLGKGTGLGLSTVYGIIKQSGGHIWVYSEPDRGSTFKIYLPLVEDTADAVLSQDEPARGGNGSEIILVVEDEEAVRNLTVAVLKMNGYTVLEAGGSQEALQMASHHQGEIDLLLTDVVMPEISGRSLANLIGISRPDLKVLYVSGYTDEVIARHGILEAGTAFLQKPFTPEALARKVAEVLDAPRP